MAPWVNYSPFYQPLTGDNQSISQGTSPSSGKNSTTQDDSQKQIKDIIGQIVGKGLTNEVNYFASQIGNIFSNAEILGQSLGVREYTSLISKLNEIQNNKQIFDEAKDHAISKGTISEIAINSVGNLYAQNKDGDFVMITPYQYAENKDDYYLLTNNDLLTLRNNSNAYIFDNTLSQTVSGSLSINDISKRIEEVVKSIGVEKESSDYYFDKVKANELQKGLQAIVQEKLNTAPEGVYKVTQSTSSQRNNINLALNYIWNNLDQQSKNTLIARAAVNNYENPFEGALESIKNILIFGTDIEQVQTIKDENIEGKSGSGSGSKSGSLTDINPLMSYVSDPKNQTYVINTGGKYGYKTNASIRPLIGAKGEVLNENYLTDIITEGGLGSLLDVAGASLGTGKAISLGDLNKLIYEGDRVAMAWLPFTLDSKTKSKIVDLESLSNIEKANNEIEALGDDVTEDQKLEIYRKYNIEKFLLLNNEPSSSQLEFMHQFMIIPTLIPESVADENNLDTITTRLNRKEEDKAYDTYDRIRSRLDNQFMRANGYAPKDRALWADDDIYKSSVFIPVQDELTSILFAGKTAPLTSKDNMNYDNIIRNVNSITNRTIGLNPEAFK